MTRLDLTQKSLGEKIGVSQTAVSKWLNGSIPRGDQLMITASCLNVTMEWLLTGQTGNGKTPEIPARAKPSARKALKDARAALDRLESELDPPA